jgi:acyl-CoA synthetase (NDP forming)
VYAPSLGATPAEVEAALEVAHKAHPDVAVVACFYGPSPTPAAPGAVPLFDAVDAAARALGRAAAYAEWLAQPEGAPAALPAPLVTAARSLVQDHLLATEPARLDEPAAMAVLDAIGLTTLPTEVVGDVDAAIRAAASMGYPVVLKAAGRDAMAKTAAAGFAIDLEGPDAMRQAWERMEETMVGRLVPALVQPMVGPGVDVSVAVRDHPSVGPVLSLGPGGAATAHDTAQLVAGSRLASLLDATARQALESALLAVAALVEEVPEICELVVNPLIVRDGTSVITQAVATVAAIQRDPLPTVRRV